MSDGTDGSKGRELGRRIEARTRGLKRLLFTTSGKAIYNTADPKMYEGFTQEEHTEACDFYNERIVKYKLTSKAYDLFMDCRGFHFQFVDKTKLP